MNGKAKIPVAATPPTQPAMPAPKWVVDAVQREQDVIDRDVRHRALQCAVAYADAGLAVTVGQFWATADAFETYIRTGEHL